MEREDGFRGYPNKLARASTGNNIFMYPSFLIS